MVVVDHSKLQCTVIVMVSSGPNSYSSEDGYIMISFIYNYIDDERIVYDRDINTRRREGVLFKAHRKEHYKVRQDPLVRAIDAWSSL